MLLSPGTALFSSSGFLLLTAIKDPSRYRQFLGWLSEVSPEIKDLKHLV